jgi:hypothetical protein
MPFEGEQFLAAGRLPDLGAESFILRARWTSAQKRSLNSNSSKLQFNAVHL